MGLAIFLYLFGFIAIIACGGDWIYLIFWGIAIPGVWYGVYKFAIGLDYKLNKEEYERIEREKIEKEKNRKEAEFLRKKAHTLQSKYNELSGDISFIKHNHIYKGEIIKSEKERNRILQSINEEQKVILKEIHESLDKIKY